MDNLTAHRAGRQHRMRYIPQVYRMRDHDDNIRDIGVQYDNDDSTYVATIRGGSFRKMFDGTERQAIVASGTADIPLAAAECAIQNLAARC